MLLRDLKSRVSPGLLEALAALRPGQSVAGIGSRETPDLMLTLMADIGHALALRGVIVRSGGADGADTAFEKGALRARVQGTFEGFAPWAGFNGRRWPVKVPAEAFDLVDEFHPAGKSLRDAPRKLMARNAQQVLGVDLESPSALVLCWTKDGADGDVVKTTQATGGTGHAIRIASAYFVPVWNLKTHGHVERPSAEGLLVGEA